MPQPPPGARQIERRSLQIGVAASLLMAAMGISVYALSGSEALLLDGLYSGVMAASSFIAARIGSNVVRPRIAPTPTATTARRRSMCSSARWC
jgi:predicted Co/Zn/Cd cation transporter (cation efflux family)